MNNNLQILRELAADDNELFLLGLAEFAPEGITFDVTRPEDSLYIDVRKEQTEIDEAIETYFGNLYNYLKTISGGSTHTVTVRYYGKILFSAGVLRINKQTGELWLCVDKDFPEIFKKIGIKGLKACRLWVDALPYNRLQTAVLEGFTQGKRFVQALRFQHEFDMERFGVNGETHHRYVKFKEV